MKTRILKTTVILFSLLLATSCISSKNYANRVSTWKGSNVNNLISSWGPPGDVYTMPNGNTMYTWLYTSDGYVTKRFNEYTDQIVERNNSSYCRTTFTANQDDIIINWQFKGNACVSFK
ncbi:hypothetical protein [Croceitalea rosinachiae]|uniref:Lipoprotein n=1 Tax=Croceitalea rosinachiae TaxID=3075596 RepID=A0ABU3ACX8_9FLAO|nr:hypothetical protein [Croceitalea sp. F388]MDT0607655.1 hypothetical protein [Croceitalea sp. F388]